VSDNDIILVGYSGHSYVLIDSAVEKGFNILGYTENKIKNNNPFNLTYLGNEFDKNFDGWSLTNSFIIGIGNNKTREKIYFFLKQKNKNIISIVSKTSSISKNVKIGEGTFVNRNVTINSFSIVGENCILNTGCIIEHECKIGNSCHVGPGAVITGNVNIGDRTFVGANAVIKPGIKIGNDVIIGAGTVVVRDIEDRQKLVGNPGRIL
jgi:sugar O-acyltransferase (sialic acid O-acetyltransferase NeuD family)